MNNNINEIILKSLRLSDGLSFENLYDEFTSFSEEEIRDSLKELEENNLILKDEEIYSFLDQELMHIGKFLANDRGFGFVERKIDDLGDIFVDEKSKNNALHGDTVLVLIKKIKGKSDEGKIVKIIERGLSKSVGTFCSEDGKFFIIPDDKKLNIKILVPNDMTLGAIDGHKVVFEIKDFLENNIAVGFVLSILGHKNDPGVDIISIIHKNGIPYEFSDKTLEEANAINDEVLESDLINRKDLREKIIFTIDGADAKDLDDAVYVEKVGENFLLGVSIADVSHYIKEGSSMDEEALERGTSVYLVDRVIPMIPHRLSNGICSLNPKVNRLTLTCEMLFDKNADLIEYDIFESVIKTTERMTYDDVNHIINKTDNDVIDKYKNYLSNFEIMFELANILKRKRLNNGSIEFEINEAKIVVDELCNPLEIVERVRGDAEKLIEDFMLAANDTVAKHMDSNGIPSIYRIHDQPRPQKLYSFSNFINNLGYKFNGPIDGVKPSQIQNVLNKIKGSNEETVISKVLLRSMAQAKYSNENNGHFGLAKENYTHFTSPIRRYPDLLLHRLIRKYVINKEEIDNSIPIADIADMNSQAERRAVEAERETQELKKAEYMLPKVGDLFVGTISSVTKFGFFVELPDTIEGLVHVSSLKDDRYNFDEDKLILVGKNKKKVFALGDKVNVKLDEVRIDERKIYFNLINTVSESTLNLKSSPDSKKSYKDKFDRLYK